MKRSLIIAVLFIVGVSWLRAEPTRFPEHNFSIEIPSGWSDLTPRPPQVLMASQNANHSQRILVFAAKVPTREGIDAAAGVRSGAKKSMASHGWKFDPEQSVTIHGQAFVSFVAHLPDGGTLTSYSMAAGEEVYMLQAIRIAGGPSDGELDAIIQSFRLLVP